MKRLLLGGLLTAFALPSSSDELFNGFDQFKLLSPPLSVVTRTLSDGSSLLADGRDIQLYDLAGNFLYQVGTLPQGASVGAFRIAPNEKFAVVGDQTSGNLYRMELDGSGQSFLVNLPGNTDAAFEVNNRALVSAATGLVGSGYELWRVKFSPVDANVILELPGVPGPVGIAGDGSAFLGTRSLGAQPGSSQLLRVDANDLQNALLDSWGDTNGMLALEFEFQPTEGDWVEETTHAGFTGDSYYRWNGPNYFNDPGNGTITFAFDLEQGGNYRLRIHNRHEHPDSTLENDCWVRMDGEDWKKVFSGGSGSVSNWNWATAFDTDSGPNPPAEYDLDAGSHTIEISGRSKNFMIDRFHLYLDGTSGGVSTSTPTAFFNAPGGEITTTVASGFDGADSIAVDQAFDTVFLAETSTTTGTQRIHAIGDVLPFQPVLVDTVGEGVLANIEFLPGDGAGFFFPFQPVSNGSLIYHREDGVSSLGERFSVVPARAQIELTGPGTSGTGPVQMTVEGGWPNGFAILFFDSASAAFPFESVYPLSGGLPLVHSPLNPDDVIVVSNPLPLNGDGDLVLDFHNTLGSPNMLMFQCLLLGQDMALIGSSATAIL